MSQPVTWSEHGREHTATWRSLTGGRAPRSVEVADRAPSAQRVLERASQGVGLLLRTPYPAARKLLTAVQHRVDSRAVPWSADPAEAFYRYRQRRRTRARVLNMLLVEFAEDGTLAMPGAPDVGEACRAAYTEPPAGSVVSLRELLGVLSAAEWYRRGVQVPALGARIHPHYGVFAPTRNEYVDLVAAAPLPPRCEVAFDIGTGSGVLAAVLARRGVAHVVATDTEPRAVASATETARDLGLAGQIDVQLTDLFPSGTADLLVCNPPWLPLAPAGPLDTAVYDEHGRMLAGFLDGAAAHLRPDGQVWLVLSTMAELLGMRPRAELTDRFAAAGLTVLGKSETRPRHRKSLDLRDPLAGLRAAERTQLWRLVRS